MTQQISVAGTGVSPVPVLVLSADLVGRGLSLRREVETDVDFLRRLYISLRWDELVNVEWPKDQKIAFLESQFDSQRIHYGKYYSQGDFAIIERHGEAIGRLYLFRSPSEIRIVDIGLLPEWRGQGLGTLLLNSVLAEGQAAGRKVSINVEVFNPARRLYDRLGFREVEQSGPYWLMEWTGASK